MWLFHRNSILARLAARVKVYAGIDTSGDSWYNGVMTVTKTWKSIERRVARFFGSERNPLSGNMSRHSASDSLHADLYIETKYRKRWPILDLWRETAHGARMEEKLPVVAIAESGASGFWVLVHSDDLTAVANQRLKVRME